MEADEPLYGVDETLAVGITNVYGMIGLTSFGYLDKEKTGIIAELNDKKGEIHVFWTIWWQGLLLRRRPASPTGMKAPKHIPAPAFPAPEQSRAFRRPLIRRTVLSCGKKQSYVIIVSLCGLKKHEIRGLTKGMWTVIYIAPTAKVAEMIQAKLTEEGFLVKSRPVNLSKQQFEILVPSGELEEVQEVLNSILHP